MVNSFQDYIHFRMHFQSVIKKSQNIDEIENFFSDLMVFKAKCYQEEKDDVCDLILDVRCFIEEFKEKNKLVLDKKAESEKIRAKLKRERMKLMKQESQSNIILIDLNSGKSYEEMRNAILVQWYAKEKSFKKLGKACGVPERTLRSWLKNSF